MINKRRAFNVSDHNYKAYDSASSGYYHRSDDDLVKAMSCFTILEPYLLLHRFDRIFLLLLHLQLEAPQRNGWLIEAHGYEIYYQLCANPIEKLAASCQYQIGIVLEHLVVIGEQEDRFYYLRSWLYRNNDQKLLHESDEYI